MTTGCTIVTPLVPDPPAIFRLLADIDPDLRIRGNELDRCWEVLHPERDDVLLVVEEPRFVQVPGELTRLLGSDLGFPRGLLDGLPGTHWLDVHLAEQSSEAEQVLVLFALNMAERGHGSYVEHNAGQLAFPASTIALGPVHALQPHGDRPAGRGSGSGPWRPAARPDDDEPLRGNRWT